MSVGDLIKREDRPAYVRFQRRSMQDHAASLAAGKYVAKDVDYALITPPYSKDVVELKVDRWMTTMADDVRNERLPTAWREQYVDAYERWKKGEELPLNGTPIKGWGVLSPAQQENLIRVGVLTVEDLAGINDEGMRRVGMGSVDLKNKATAWLSQLADKGPLTMEIAALKRANAEKDGQLEALTKKIELLTRDVMASQFRAQAQPVIEREPEPSIQASDILSDTI